MGGGLVLKSGLGGKAHVLCWGDFGMSDSDTINSLIVHLLLVRRDKRLCLLVYCPLLKKYLKNLYFCGVGGQG